MTAGHTGRGVAKAATLLVGATSWAVDLLPSQPSSFSMLVRTRRRFLILAIVASALLTVYRYQPKHALNISTEEPVEEDCLIPPLELWPADLNKSLGQSGAELNCSANGLRFTLEKPRNTLDTDALLPKRAWLEHGRLKLSPEEGPFHCDAFPIHRLDEYHSVYGEAVTNVKSGDTMKHPQIMLLCNPNSGDASWNTDILLTQRRFYLCGSSKANIPTKPANSSAVNILLLGVDSLSRLGWLRYMPKTMNIFSDLAKQRGSIFQKYHIVGDGTTANLLAMLTGFFEEELPESRRFALKMLENRQGLLETSISGEEDYKGVDESPLDSFPWIWKELREKGGYATHFIEDSPRWGTFQYRLQGFGNAQTPVDSYGRPCMVAAAQDETTYGKELGCTASMPTHQVLLQSLREFFDANSDRPRFSLTFLSEMVHEEPSKAALIDADVAKLLEEIDSDDAKAVGAFANTVVVLFSDHGPRMGKARLSLQGKLEERLPLLGILLPRKLASSWSEALETLQLNSDRVASPFDLHATLKHLLRGSAEESSGSRSLFTPLSWKRTCSEARVARHWCTCAHWVTLRPNLAGFWSEEVTRAAEMSLETINSATRVLFGQGGIRVVGRCEKLELEEIVSAEVSRLPQDVVRFKGSADRDGRIPVFDRSTDDPSTSTLRLHLRVRPKDAHFEVLLHRHPEDGTFHEPKLESIQRLDAFEDAAKCLDSQRWSQARRFCICR